MRCHRLRPSKPWAARGTALALLAVAGCTTAEDLFPTTGSLRLTLRSGALGFQSSPQPTTQLARFAVDEALAVVSGQPAAFSFLGGAPCVFTDTPFHAADLAPVCRGSGLVLGTGSERDVTFRVRISRLELRRAGRPDVPPGGDHDGDGVANSRDNCPIVPNPIPSGETSQPDVNGDGVGDACSGPDAAQAPTRPDRDLDGIEDFADLCLWVPDPAQQDTDLDGIGDACAEVAPVILPGGAIVVECAVKFTPQPSTLGFFAIAFDEGSALLCNGSFTGCTLGPAAIRAFLLGTDPAAGTPCTLVP